MWISDPHQNLHSCVSHPVDWGPHLLWQGTSLIFVLIFISDIFLQFFCGKTAEKSEQKIGTKIGTEIGTPSRGSAVWVCKLIPCILAGGLRFPDKSQRNEQLLETCLCCANLFCIAPARLDHIAPWLQWISLSKQNFGNQKIGGKSGLQLAFTKKYFGGRNGQNDFMDIWAFLTQCQHWMKIIHRKTLKTVVPLNEGVWR